MSLPPKYERNARLIRKRLENQIGHSLEKGNKYIDKELAGPFNFLVREGVKLFYNTIKKHDMAEGTRNQIDVVFKAAKEALLNPDMELEELVNKYYQDYLKGDQTTRALRTSHRNYQWCVENLKVTFKAQLESIIPMLKCDAENITTYLGLTKATYKTRQATLKALFLQKDSMEAALRKIAEDKSILNLPMGRDVLFKVLKQGYDETWDELREEVTNMNFD